MTTEQTETIRMTWLEFEEKFKPKINHFNGDDNGSYNGWMYETYGKETAYIQTLNVHNIWTIRDNGYSYISQGKGLIDRIGYIETEIPWSDGETYFIVDKDDIIREMADSAIMAMEKAMCIEEDLAEEQYEYNLQINDSWTDGALGLRDLLEKLFTEAEKHGVITEDFDYWDWCDEKSVSSILNDMAVEKGVQFKITMQRL